MPTGRKITENMISGMRYDRLKGMSPKGWLKKRKRYYKKIGVEVII